MDKLCDVIIFVYKQNSSYKEQPERFKTNPAKSVPHPMLLYASKGQMNTLLMGKLLIRMIPYLIVKRNYLFINI